MEADVDIDVNNGNIDFEMLGVGKTANFKVKNGDVSGTLSGGWDDFAITCTNKKGSTNLPAEKSGGSKSLIVSANNGDIDIDFSK